MDLRTSSPFWLMKNGYIKTYPAVSSNQETDVAVMGAGISGALAAYTLARAGLNVIVLDKRHPGMGSTAASTALLQYEIDEPLHVLKQLLGPAKAEKAYQACHEAIDDIEAIIRKEKLSCDFEKRQSLQYASYKKDVSRLEKEIEALQRLGFAVSWLDSASIENRFGFTAPAGILSTQGAEVDAYKLAHQLLSLPMSNLSVHDTTEVRDIQPTRRGVRLRTSNGHTITAGRLVIACGYESQKWLPFSLIHLLTTYALVSKPVDPDLFWEKKSLIWETKTPYLYLRHTAEDRILVGGRDDQFSDPFKRKRALPRKINQLLADARKLMPHMPVTADFAWAGVFGSTKDGLGYMGKVPGMSNCYAILGCGGNGIVFSMIGARLILDELNHNKNPYATVFAFDR